MPILLPHPPAPNPLPNCRSLCTLDVCEHAGGHQDIVSSSRSATPVLRSFAFPRKGIGIILNGHYSKGGFEVPGMGLVKTHKARQLQLFQLFCLALAWLGLLHNQQTRMRRCCDIRDLVWDASIHACDQGFHEPRHNLLHRYQTCLTKHLNSNLQMKS